MFSYIPVQHTVQIINYLLAKKKANVTLLFPVFWNESKLEHLMRKLHYLDCNNI